MQRVARRGVGDDPRLVPGLRVGLFVSAEKGAVLGQLDDLDGSVVGAVDPCRREDAGGLADGVGGLVGVAAEFVARPELRVDRAASRSAFRVSVSAWRKRSVKLLSPRAMPPASMFRTNPLCLSRRTRAVSPPSCSPSETANSERSRSSSPSCRTPQPRRQPSGGSWRRRNGWSRRTRCRARSDARAGCARS